MAIRLIASTLWALVLPLGAYATPPAPGKPPSMTDPAVFVPPARYRSVFADTSTGVEQGQVDWKKANADVGEFRNGFVDILKWEAAQETMGPTADAPAQRH